jgi:hypothetical protein
MRSSPSIFLSPESTNQLRELIKQTILETLPLILSELKPIIQQSQSNNDQAGPIGASYTPPATTPQNEPQPIEILPPPPADDDGDPLPALPAPVLTLYRDLTGSRAIGDKHRLTHIANTFDKPSGGFGMYWLGQAILMADQCLAPWGKPISFPYIRSILKRWAREGTWGSDVEDIGSENQPTTEGKQQATETKGKSNDTDQAAGPPPASEALQIYRQETGADAKLTSHQISLIEQVKSLDVWRTTCAWWVAVVDGQGREKKRYNPAHVESLYDRYCQNIQRHEANRWVSNMPILLLPMGIREEYLYRFDNAETADEQEAIAEEARAWREENIRIEDDEETTSEEQDTQNSGGNDTGEATAPSFSWALVGRMIALARQMEAMGMNTIPLRKKIASIEETLEMEGKPRPADLDNDPTPQNSATMGMATYIPQPQEESLEDIKKRHILNLDDYEPPPGASWEMAAELEKQAKSLDEEGSEESRAKAWEIWRALTLLEEYLRLRDRRNMVEQARNENDDKDDEVPEETGSE